MRYAIGKRTRHAAMDVVSEVPYDLHGRAAANRYEQLRVNTYGTIQEAEAAANEATRYNPVGFVVVQVGAKRE